MKITNVDHVLQLLADTEGTHITLYVKGNVITGETIKSSVFARRLGNPEGLDPAPFEFLAAMFDETETRHAELLSREGNHTEEEQKALRKMRRRYITLKDARFLTGNSGFQPKDSMSEIRVRLDSVDAWSWGSMSSSIETT